MKVYGILFLIFAVAVLAAFADETNLTLTVDGVTYSNVTFGTVSPSSVTIRHSSGIAKLPLAKLPPDLQQKFGYDPQKAVDWQKTQQQAAAAQLAAQQSAKQRAVWLKEHVQNIGGTVTDVVEGKGVILSNEMNVDQYIRYGGTDPAMLRISFGFLQCNTKDFVNGSTISCAAYPEGTYSYTTVMGAGMKINRWVYYSPYDKAKGGTVFGY